MKDKAPGAGLLGYFPSELLVKISNDLNVRDLYRLSEVCSFFYKALEKPKRMRPELIDSNLRQLNCSKKIVEIDDSILSIHPWKNKIIIVCRNSIRCWDFGENKYLWKFLGAFDNQFKFYKKLSIINDRVFGVADKKAAENCLTYDIKTLLIMNIRTGEILFESNDRLLVPELTCFFNDQIIKKRENGEIAYLDLDCGLIRIYDSKDGDRDETLKLLVNESYIVEIKKTYINIICRLSAEVKLINLGALDLISSGVVWGDFLVCGLNTKATSQDSVILINMQKNLILAKFTLKELYDYHEGLYSSSISFFYGSIQSIVINENYAFLAHQRGKVILLDLKTRESKLLKDFKSWGVFKLTLQDSYLFVHIEHDVGYPSELHIFDVKTLKYKNKIEINGLDTALWHNGNLLISLGSSFIQYDFKVLSQGEVCFQEEIEDEVFSIDVQKKF